MALMSPRCRALALADASHVKTCWITSIGTVLWPLRRLPHLRPLRLLHLLPLRLLRLLPLLHLRQLLRLHR